MLLIRPLPQSTRAGRRLRAPRRFLLIEARSTARAAAARGRTIEETFHGFLYCPVQDLGLRDAEFEAVRNAVLTHQRAVHSWDGSHDGGSAQLAYEEAWAACKAVAQSIFDQEPCCIRDVFLRAEALTMHYGDGCLYELLESPCPAERMLGGLLAACWKVGGAANVEAYKGVPNV